MNSSSNYGSSGRNGSQKTRVMVQLAILAAIMIVMAYTPLGYLKITAIGLSITFMMIPVIVGAVVIGPGAATVLGAVFGLTSFSQCFGADFFGTTLFGISPIATFITTVLTRTLMGYLTGIIFKLVKSADKKDIFAYPAASIAAPLLNTVLFIGCLLIFFLNSEFITELRGGRNLISFVAFLVGVNGVVEIVVSFLVGTVLSKALIRFKVKK